MSHDTADAGLSFSAKCKKLAAPFKHYSYLIASVFAALGMWLSSKPRSVLSFLAPVFSLELCMYYVLFAIIVISGIALVTKLVFWKNYRAKSPFAKPQVDKVAWYMAALAFVLFIVLFIDRACMGLIALTQASIASDQNPNDFLASAIYMTYNSWPVFVHGILTTVGLATFGTLIAFFLAILLVFLRVQATDRQDNDFVRFIKSLGRGFAKFYSTIVRGTPMMIQAGLIYFSVFGILRATGASANEISEIWSTFTAGLVIISLNSTAYMMEVLRGGIEAVDRGQMEAARSLGLSQWQAMRKVIFPQGLKNAIPALSNELVVNIKDSSVLSVIGVFELMFATTTVAGIYFRQQQIYFVAALIYLCLTMLASHLLSMLSHRLEVQTSTTFLSTSDMHTTIGTSTKTKPELAKQAPLAKAKKGAK